MRKVEAAKAEARAQAEAAKAAEAAKYVVKLQRRKFAAALQRKREVVAAPPHPHTPRCRRSFRTNALPRSLSSTHSPARTPPVPTRTPQRTLLPQSQDEEAAHDAKLELGAAANTIQREARRMFAFRFSRDLSHDRRLSLRHMQRGGGEVSHKRTRGAMLEP